MIPGYNLVCVDIENESHIYPARALGCDPIGLDDLAAYVANWRTRKGFQTPAEVGEDMNHKLLRVHEEVTEAGLAVRKGGPDMKEHFFEELADVVIRVADIFGTCGVGFEEAVMEKMLKNEQRPIRHGNKSPW